MGDKSNIEWTDATWNPIVGCSIVSPGCTNCYAMKMAARIEAMARHPMAAHVKVQTHYAGTTKKVNGNAVWTGKVALAPEHILTAPLRWKRPRRIFVNSMGDLFHESIPDEWIDRVFEVMAVARHHIFQVLTKRAERMRAYFSDPNVANALRTTLRIIDDPAHAPAWPLPNVWLGVSAERQQEADERIPLLLQTPAAVRFVSLEPLLGPIDLDAAWHGESALESECWGDCAWCEKGYPPLHNCRHHESMFDGRSGLDWVICGGESGHNARPMHPDWARSLRDQCAAAGVSFFFKQWGEWAPFYYRDDGQPRKTFAFDDVRVHRIGKANAGAVLDGREWREMPGRAPTCVDEPEDAAAINGVLGFGS